MFYNCCYFFVSKATENTETKQFDQNSTALLHPYKGVC